MSSAEKRQRTVGESRAREHARRRRRENPPLFKLWAASGVGSCRWHVRRTPRQWRDVEGGGVRRSEADFVLSLWILNFTGLQEKCADALTAGSRYINLSHTFSDRCCDICAAHACRSHLRQVSGLTWLMICLFSPVADPIDIVKDYITPHEYLVEEDPKLYQSLKTKRGPLSDDWIEEINQDPGECPVMCAYKLCKVEFRYWGMQSKIERFIHDVGRYGTRVRQYFRKVWVYPWKVWNN